MLVLAQPKDCFNLLCPTLKLKKWLESQDPNPSLKEIFESMLWLEVFQETCKGPYLPVTFDGIFTSTNIIKWRINSVGTQYLWSFTQPIIIHCITSRIILNWNTFPQIEKYKWSPSGYFHRYKPKLLSSWGKPITKITINI